MGDIQRSTTLSGFRLYHVDLTKLTGFKHDYYTPIKVGIRRRLPMLHEPATFHWVVQPVTKIQNKWTESHVNLSC